MAEAFPKKVEGDFFRTGEYKLVYVHASAAKSPRNLWDLSKKKLTFLETTCIIFGGISFEQPV